ncbi:MAG: hypothetical protein EXR66_00750 [Dehalococcoidia bacterium]|nr:hypothetical protein [Dehalococcoidia bacterium]
MTEHASLAASGQGRRRVPGWLVPFGLLLVSFLSIGAVFWGHFVAHPGIRVFEFDAGPVAGLEIGRVRPFPEFNLYLVGLADGRVRVIDGKVHSSQCLVIWNPDDERGRGFNPHGTLGTYEDHCTGAYWAVTGNEIDPAGRPVEPLRTFELAYKTLPDGQQHIFVEVIGRDRVTPSR